jgi:hypothetical protein
VVSLEGAEISDPNQRGAKGVRESAQEGVVVEEPLLTSQPFRSRIFALQRARETLAIMHGSSFEGDGENAIRNLAVAIKEILGSQ